MTDSASPGNVISHIGLTLQQKANIADADLETVYRYAMQCFMTGQRDKSANWLYLLVHMNPYNFDYWMMLGQSLQATHHHEEALYCFSRTGSMKITDPRSAFFAGHSFAALGNAERAHMAFDTAAKLCGRSQQYADMRAQALAALQQYATGDEK